jgi:hypothetical protein
MAAQSSTTSNTGDMDAIYKPVGQDAFNVDIEQKVVDDCHLVNDTVRNYVWRNVTAVVKDHETKEPKAILQDVAGVVEAGMFPNHSNHLLDEPS